ncbi:L-serine ammonia-lyase, iron-sulfur-dependent subunit beta [Cohnella herbarum]|uniref:L-serine deaminase n=1 Tax=Cohnella herbarum TaxID=2728023 RepID=A0A7Z2ZKE6_9BACL|nr:L-serine ammonia-lyase, iron-sulfur-dependent subunit beta [Cohnella herbarum]QJD82699.1 L-serine ammonia-lyase, iron-sulfur-dependent, subunit beta [Cohnella herbarum]
MRFKDVFSIIGPSMIGPSSSHTAGAVRLGRIARQIVGGLPEEADIYFYGSFADTYRGHGTDLAIAAGLLDCDTDDQRIREALRLASEAGINIRFHKEQAMGVHPNTAKMVLKRDDRTVTVTGCSIGGGNVEILNVNHFEVKFTAVYPTLLIFHADRPGMIAEMTEIVKDGKMNIGYMEVDRKSRNGDVLTVIESDEAIPGPVIERIESLSNVQRVCVIDLTNREGSS